MTARARIYTPSREDAGRLRERTVGRSAVLDRCQRSLRQAATSDNRSHIMLIGPRGQGKSHVVTLLQQWVREEADLNDRLAVVALPEDGIGVTRPIDLFRHVVEAVTGSPPSRSATQVDLQGLITEVLAGRVLVLMLENADRVLRSMGEPGERSLRSWVETSGEVLLIFTTPLLFKGVTDRDRPFFNAFHPIHMKGLSPEEGHKLLTLLARQRGDVEMVDFLDTDKGHARVRALAELAGGSPRIWTILSECMNPESLETLIPAVRDLLEELVPYYQQLLFELPPQHARVVRALAEDGGDSMTVSEIDEAAEIGSNPSQVLRRMEADHWVERAEPLPGEDGRVRRYRLREPLLRYHFQYRSGDTAPLVLVVAMLRVAFDEHELVALAARTPVRSESFAHLAELIDEDRPESWAHIDVEELVVRAKLWQLETGPFSRSRVGMVLEREISADLTPDQAREALERLQEASSSDRDRAVLELALVSVSAEMDVMNKWRAVRPLWIGLDRFDPLAIELNLAATAFLSEQFSESVEKAIRIHLYETRNSFGAAHETTRAIEYTLLECLHELDRFAEGVLLAAELDERFSHDIGSDHIRTRLVRLIKASMALGNGDTNSAKQIYRELIQAHADSELEHRGRVEWVASKGLISACMAARDGVGVRDQYRKALGRIASFTFLTPEDVEDFLWDWAEAEVEAGLGAALDVARGRTSLELTDDQRITLMLAVLADTIESDSPVDVAVLERIRLYAHGDESAGASLGASVRSLVIRIDSALRKEADED